MRREDHDVYDPNTEPPLHPGDPDVEVEIPDDDEHEHQDQQNG